MNKKRSRKNFMKETISIRLTTENNHIPHEPKRKCTLETKLNSKTKVSCRRPTIKTLKRVKQYAAKNMGFLNGIGETRQLENCPALIGEIQNIMKLYGVKVNSQTILEAAEKNLLESDRSDDILDSMGEVFKEFDNYSPATSKNNDDNDDNVDDETKKFEDTSWLFLSLKIEGIVIASVFVFRNSKPFWEVGDLKHLGPQDVAARDGIYVRKSLGFQSVTGSVAFMLCKLLFPEYQYASINGSFIPWIINYAQRCKVSRIYANPLYKQSEILQRKYGFKQLETQKDNLVFRFHTFKNFLGMPPKVAYVVSEDLDEKYMLLSTCYDYSNNTAGATFDHLVGNTWDWWDTSQDEN